jgi:hypothetical protein
VDALVSDPGRRTGREEIRDRLVAWQGLDARLRPLLEETGMLRELVPLAAEVSNVAAAGLEALAFVEQDGVAPEAWRGEIAARLEGPERRPHALEVAFRPAVEKLVAAALPRGEGTAEEGGRP